MAGIKCGLVLLNYNDYETTIEFLENVKKYEVIEKIIIVDNNSNDESVKYLEKYKSEKIKLIVSDENKGYGSGNNIGIRYLIEECNCEFIIISNPDVIVEEHVIEKCIYALETNEMYAVASARIMEADNKLSSSAWKLPSFSDNLMLMIPYFSKYPNKKMSYNMNNAKNGALEVEAVPGSFFVAKSKTLEEVNYFDEEIFLFCEESILGFKLKLNGYKEILLTSLEYIHNHSVSINKNVNLVKKYKILAESREIYISKYLKVNKFKLYIYKIIINLLLVLRRIQERMDCEK